ncbi:MAG TPA: hypothetical protein VFT51_03250 [Bacillales bacterium]|nr:hypothetical protein [Bacillales bacterium]
MLIKKCEGVELEKSSPTSPEDAFNRSIVTFEAEGKERTFHLLYLRFFEDHLVEFLPFQQDPLFKVGDREVTIKDVAALAALIHNPSYLQRKRVYINEPEPFIAFYQNLHFDEIRNVFESLQSVGSYEWKSSSSLVNLNGLGTV